MSDCRFAHFMRGGIAMSSDFKEANKLNPCPICGKDHWCSHTVKVPTMWLCNRTHNIPKGTIIQGHDQREYECKGENKNGTLFFYLKEDCDRWREEHQQKKKGSGKKNKRMAAEQLPVQKPSEKKEEIKPLTNDKLDTIYRYMLSLLKLSEADRNYLNKEGFTDVLIEQYSIRSMVDTLQERENIVNQLLKKFGDLTGVPGFFKKDNRWCIAEMNGILFPIPDIFGNIYRLRIRLRNATNGKGKYRNFAVPKEPNGCPSGNQCGYFSKNTTRNDIAFIIEGEKKGIITNAVYHYPVVTLPGVNSFSKLKDPINTEAAGGASILDMLKKMGVKLIVVAYDADKHHNKAVLSCEERTIELVKSEGFAVATAEWDEAAGKGLDDLLVYGFKPQFALW